MEPRTIGPLETLDHRPFTDLRNSTVDLQAMRFMIACVGHMLEQRRPGLEAEGAIVHYHPAETNWVYRIVISQPHRLAKRSPITVVGFFGQRRPEANLPLAQQLDHELLPELFRHRELLCYMSLSLPTRNYANLVLFASPEGKEEWGGSALHAEAVRLLTPDFYDSVRLYNGRMRYGLDHIDGLHLDLVKYYDYHAQPVWRAVRPLPSQVQEWYQT